MEIKPTIEHWAPTPRLRRREEVILNRLWTGLDCLPLTKTDIHARNPRRIFKPETGYSLNTLAISEEI